MFRSKITQIVHPFSLYEIQFPSAKSKWQRESRGNFDIQQIIYMLMEYDRSKSRSMGKKSIR